MRKVFAIAAALVLLSLGVAAQANVFDLGPGYTNLETVTVGDPGNPGELSGAGAGGVGKDRICGSVSYTYNIGKYELTAKQYCDFLNAKAKSDPYGLYNTQMDTAVYLKGCNIKRSGVSGSYTYSVDDDWANRPVNLVSFWDACRFANWLGNGQGSGDTENGAYTIPDGYNGEDGRTIQRNAGATWAVSSEDEWYKAAYYKGGGTNAGYWVFPTQSNTAPSWVGGDNYTDPGNHANFNNTMSGPYYRTNVGEFENSAGPYGTFDQAGNVCEWNEGMGYTGPSYASRGYRGCSFNGGTMPPPNSLNSSWRSGGHPEHEYYYVGFRVSAVPEPAYGISNRAAYHSIISTAIASFTFKVWGKVTILGLNSFDVDDGSGTVVRVVAPGFGGIQNGDYATAKGKFYGEGANRVLNAQASDVVKL